MNNHKGTIIKHMEFVKVNDNVYNANIEESVFIDMMDNIIKSITICENGTFSPIMDIPLSEELIARIIADAFIFMHRKLIEDMDGSIIINFNLSEITYRIALANNSDKLGGIVYGMVV